MIKISDKEYPVNFGHAALYMFEQRTGKGLHKADAETLSFFYEMLYCGIYQGHRIEKKDFPFATMEDFLDALPQGMDELAVVREAFMREWADQTSVGKK